MLFSKAAQITEEQFKEMRENSEKQKVSPPNQGNPQGEGGSTEEVPNSSVDTVNISLSEDGTELQAKDLEEPLTIKVPEGGREQEVSSSGDVALEGVGDSLEAVASKGVQDDSTSTKNKADLSGEKVFEGALVDSDDQVGRKETVNELATDEERAQTTESEDTSNGEEIGENVKNVRSAGDENGVLNEGGENSNFDKQQQIATLEDLSAQLSDMLSQLGIKFGLQ